MANSTRPGVKRTLLLSFVAVGIILIGMIWVDGLTGSEPTTPAYYRDSYQVAEPIPTVTTAAVEPEGNPDGSPEDHRHGQGQREGQGWGRSRDDSLDY